MHNWYLDCYQTLNEYIYGSSAVMGTYEDMILCILSTIAVLFAVAFPFVFVIAVCKKLLNWLA